MISFHLSFNPFFMKKLHTAPTRSNWFGAVKLQIIVQKVK
jgi:hypothetical protein